jgi:outer membrane protein
MKNKLVFVCLAISLLALAGVIKIQFFPRKHLVAYIELGKIFNDFDMAKQYHKKLESVAFARKGIIDSLELNLRSQSRAIQSAAHQSKDQIEKFQLDKGYYEDKKRQFDEDNNALQKEYNEEIIKQLNQYVRDYGEKSGYDFIYGAEGSGVIMYGNDKLNITAEVTKYINERFNGSSK